MSGKSKEFESETIDTEIRNELSEKLKSPAQLDVELEVSNGDTSNHDGSNMKVSKNNTTSNRPKKRKTVRKDAKQDVDDYNWINEYRKTLMGNPLISEQYHDSEIKNARSMLIWSMSLLCIIIIGTMVLCTICVLQDKTTEAIISGTVGTIISGIISYITNAFNKTLKSKKSYFDAETERHKNNNMILLIQTISNEKVRNSVVEDVVRNYFGVGKDKDVHPKS